MIQKFAQHILRLSLSYWQKDVAVLILCVSVFLGMGLSQPVSAACDFGNLEVAIPGFPKQDICDIAKGGVVSYVNAIVQLVIAIVVAAGIIMVVISGYFYMTAGGNADRVAKAKTYLAAALLGIALALTAWVILNTISPQFASNVREPRTP